MMDRERPSASDAQGRIPEAWIGKRVMIETTEALSTDLRVTVPVYLEDVNERGIVVSATSHHDQSHPQQTRPLIAQRMAAAEPGRYGLGCFAGFGAAVATPSPGEAVAPAG